MAERAAWAEAERLSVERRCCPAVFSVWKQRVEEVLTCCEKNLMPGGLTLTDRGRAETIRTLAAVFKPVRLGLNPPDHDLKSCLLVQLRYV